MSLQIHINTRGVGAATTRAAAAPVPRTLEGIMGVLLSLSVVLLLNALTRNHTLISTTSHLIFSVSSAVVSITTVISVALRVALRVVALRVVVRIRIFPPPPLLWQ